MQNLNSPSMTHIEAHAEDHHHAATDYEVIDTRQQKRSQHQDGTAPLSLHPVITPRHQQIVPYCRLRIPEAGWAVQAAAGAWHCRRFTPVILPPREISTSDGAAPV